MRGRPARSRRRSRNAARRPAPARPARRGEARRPAAPSALRPARRRAPPGSRFRTKRIYEPAAADDGVRVLIMRLWPRGIRKERVDHWLRELGPEKPLLRAFLDGKIDWAGYQPRYLAGLERPEAQEAVARVLDLGRAGTVTLLCGCADEQRCHRTLLRKYLDARML